MNQVFVGDLSFVWGSMFFLLVKFDLAHMVSINTSVFFMEKIPQIHHILKEEKF